MPFKFDPLFIEDPLEPRNNVGRNCFRIFQVKFEVLLFSFVELQPFKYSDFNQSPPTPLLHCRSHCCSHSCSALVKVQKCWSEAYATVSTNHELSCLNFSFLIVYVCHTFCLSDFDLAADNRADNPNGEPYHRGSQPAESIGLVGGESRRLSLHCFILNEHIGSGCTHTLGVCLSSFTTLEYYLFEK